MALSPNKQFLAICEVHKDDKSSYISFYDVKASFFKNVKQPINVCD